MVKNFLLAALAISALFVLMAAPAFADGNPHVAEAIAHAEEAAKHGGMGHADAVVGHAQGSVEPCRNGSERRQESSS